MLLHNRFDLERNYHQDDVEEVLRRGLAIEPAIGRFVGMGCGRGSVFKVINELDDKKLVLVGIEAGSKVGACRPREYVDDCLGVSAQLHRCIYGVDAERLFCESESILQQHGNEKVALIHLYDGGVFSKQSIENCVTVCARVPPRSVFVFVTSTIKNTTKTDPRSDHVHIIRTMRSHGWCHRRKNNLQVREAGSQVRMMVALYFQKRAKIHY